MAPAALPATRGLQVPQTARSRPVHPRLLLRGIAARGSRLAVEVDGSQHYTADGLADDAEHTGFLEAMGIEVMRLPNNDVLTNADGTIEVIRARLEEER